MTDSSELRNEGRLETDSEVRRTTEWDQITRRYRRGLGGWRWLALLLIPLLLALLGLAFKGGTGGATDVSPFSISKSGSSITVKADVPDDAAKTALIDNVKEANPGATIVDEVTVKAGSVAPAVAGLGSILSATAGLPDFGLNFDGSRLALTGAAATDVAKSAVESAAKTAFPSWTIDNGITVTAPSTPATTTSTPPAAEAPVSVTRSGSSVTVTAEVADDATKTALLAAVKAANPGAAVVDQVTVKAGSPAVDAAAVGTALGGVVSIPNYGFTWDGTKLTLTGEAPDDAAKAKAEADAKTAFPAATIDNQITVKAASPPPAAGCGTLQATIQALTAKSKITFTPGSAVLTPSSVTTVAAIAKQAKACPTLKLTVAGHTDITAPGDGKALSLRRANAVKAALVRGGVAAGNITTVGYGETKPIASNSTPAGMAANRRVEITVK